MGQADLSVSVALTGEQQAQTAIQQINQSIRGLSGGFTDANASASAFTSGLRSMAEAENSLRNSVQNSITDLKAQRSALQDPGFRAAQKEAEALRAEINAMTAPQQGFAQRMGGMATAIKGFIALQAVGYLKDMTMAIFDATAEMQSLKMGMTAVMKSSSLAAAEMERLKEVAKLPGLGYAEAVKMSVGLQSAGFSAEQARKSMAAFGNALATVGKGKADLDGVGLALTQIMAKGKVSAEEINQIAERVPQIRIAMQDAFGTANTELIQKMGLTSGQFIRGVTEELGKLEKVTGGLKNGAENLSDAWFQFKANVGGSGSAFQSALNGLAGLISGANGMLEEQSKKNKQREIDDAMWIIGSKKALLAKMSESDRKYYEKELTGLINEKRAFLAAIAKENAKADEDRKKKATELTDGQKDLQRQASHLAKASLAEDIKAEEMANKLRIKDAAGRDESLQQAAKIHEARVAEIKEEWGKKGKKGKAAKSPWEIELEERERVFKESLKLDKEREDANNAREAADLKTQKALQRLRENDMAAELKAIRKHSENVEQANKERAAMDEQWAKFNAEVAKMRQDAADAQDKAIVQAFDPLRSSIQGMVTDMLNGEFTMKSFGESFKAMLVGMVAELAANAAIFGLLNLVSGGAAGAFAGGLSGLSGLLMGSFAVGTQGLGQDGPIYAHKGEAILPASVSAAARAGNWGPAVQFMGQGGSSTTNHTSSQTNHITIHVAGTKASAEDIAKAVVRAQKIQGRTRAGTSF